MKAINFLSIVSSPQERSESGAEARPKQGLSNSRVNFHHYTPLRSAAMVLCLLMLGLGQAWAERWVSSCNIQYYTHNGSEATHDGWYNDGDGINIASNDVTLEFGTLTQFYFKKAWAKGSHSDDWGCNGNQMKYGFSGNESEYNLDWSWSKDDNPRYYEFPISQYDVISNAPNKPGANTMRIYFNLNYNADGSRQSKWLYINFTIPGFTTTSTSKSFGTTIPINTESETTISFGNHYGTALTTGNCVLSGTNASEFEVWSISETGVQVAFKPTTAGSKSATLTITDAHSKTCTISLSATATDNGTKTRLYFNNYKNNGGWSASSAKYRFSVAYTSGVYTHYPMTQCANSTYNWYADVEIQGKTISIDRYNPSSPYNTWNTATPSSNALSATYPYAISNSTSGYSAYATNHPFNRATGGKIYYDNSQSAYTGTLYLIIGHDTNIDNGNANTFSKTYKLTNVENTKLYYKDGINSDSWNDADYYAVIGTSSNDATVSGWGTSWGSGSLSDKGTGGYTTAYKSVLDLLSGNVYLASAAASNSAMTIAKRASTASSSFNSTQTIQYALSTDGGETYTVMSSGTTPGTIGISAYKFTDGTYDAVTNTSNSQSITGGTTGTYTKSVPAAYTGSTTLSASAADGYTFMGWKIGTTETTATSPCYPKEATTYTARFLQKATPTQYTVSGEEKYCSTITITLSGSQTNASYQLYNGASTVGTAKAGTGSALTWDVSEPGTYTVQAVQTDYFVARAMSGSATVYTPERITTQPTSPREAYVDVAIEIGLEAEGENNVAYQWQTCNSDGTGAANISNGGAYANCTTDTLSFTAASAGTYYFRCIVSDDCNNKDTSNIVTVTAYAPHDITYTAPTHGSYTITVGEEEAVSESTTAYYGTTITLAATPAGGYEFSSWSVTGDVSGDDITVTNNQFTMPDEDVTVSVTFSGRTYNINYFRSDGTQITGLTPSTYVCGAGDVLLPTPDSACHTFVAWHKNSINGDTKVKIDNGAYSTYNFYGEWSLNSHTLTWDFDGGSTSATAGDDYTAGGSVNCGASLTYPANNTMSRNGYTFSGWSTDATEMPDENLTITAQWVGNTYAITYRECDNSTAITGLAPTTYTCGVGVAELPTPTKSGYTFDAWYSEYCVYEDNSGAGFGWVNDCKRTAIDAASYGEYILLAKWHQTVTLDMQGIGSNLTPTVEYLGTALSGYSASNIRSGALLGYYTAATDGTKVLNADGTFASSNVTDYITDGAWTKAGATTLYAHWDATIDLPDTLDVSNYVAYGGGLTLVDDTLNYNTGSHNSLDGYTTWQANMVQAVYNVTIKGNYDGNARQWQLSLINKAGTVDSTCTFTKVWQKGDQTESKQWNLSGIDVGEYVIRLKNLTEWGHGKVLYMAMEPIKVTYNANGGTCATSSAYYTGSAMTLPTPTRSGYVFEGWYNVSTKIGNAGGSYEPTASITLTAKWGVITNLPNTFTKANVGDYSSDIEWYGDDEDYFDYGSEDHANLDRWAKWEVNVVPCEYTISWVSDYNASDAIKWGLILFNGADTVATYIPETKYGLKTYTYSDKWDLTKDKDDNALSAGTYTLEVKNMKSHARPKLQSLTLAADLFTITYDAGTYGSGSIAAGQKIGCQNFTLSSSTFTRTGYEQDGWATSDGGDVVYDLGGTYSTDAALTLYPHWTCVTPSAPTAFTAGTITDGGVTFTITDEYDAASYDIFYSTSSTAPTSETAATTTADSKTKAVTGLTAGTTYYAWVRAVCDGSHKSAWVALEDDSFSTDYSITMGTVTTRQHDGSTVGGSISASPSSAAASTSVTLTATPTSGYAFIAWKIEKSSDNSDITNTLIGADSTSSTPTFTMPAYSVTVKATFARQYTITYKEDDKTTVIGDLEPTTYIYGVGVPALPTPVRTGYTFAAWYKWTCVDGGSGFTDGCIRTAIDDDSYGDYTFYGKWTINNHDITYTAPTNGSYTITVGSEEAVSESTTADYGTTITLSATPTNSCYTFAGWTITGATPADASAATTTFTMPDNDVTIVASFAQKNLALGKTAKAYKAAGTDYASNANDGNLDNLWKLAEPIPEGEIRDSVWWYVDLGDEYTIQHVELFWEGAYATHFIMQTRKAAPTIAQESDDDAWETFLDYTGAQTAGNTESDVNKYGDVTGAKAAFSRLPKGRYVRIRMLDAVNWAWGIKLRELRVFGSAELPDDDVAPVITSASYNGVTGDKTGIKFNVTATDNSGYPVKDYIVKDPSGAKHYARESEGVITVTGMPTIKNQTVNIYAVDSAANISTAYPVSSVSYVNPTENLALDKDAYACQDWHDQPAIEGIDKANDGDVNTYWTSYPYGTTTNEWWYVDLGDFYDIRRIEVKWKSTTEYYSTDYSVQYRQNAPANNSGNASSEWDAISEFTNVTTGDKSADIESSVSARYICLRSVERYNSGNQLQLAELRVFGKAFGTPDNTAPAWTDANCAITDAEANTITMTLEATDENPANIYDFVVTVDNGSTTRDYERSTTPLNNEITITDAEFIEPCHTYTITAKCYDHVGNEATKVFSDVATVLTDGTNLALNKTATAGTTEDLGHPASKAVDGDTDTQWSGNSGEKEAGVNQWLTVDLGKDYNVDSIKISWGDNSGTRPKNYKIQVSHDNSTFETIIHRTSADGERENKYLKLATKARYVRVWADEYNTYGMCISELEVYGACYTESISFNGNVSGHETEWSNVGNWSSGVLPTIHDDVVITKPVMVDITTAAARSIVLDQSSSKTGSLTINAGKGLVIEGEVKKTTDGETLVATEAADITIGSDASHGNGALVMGGYNGTNAATVQFYTKAGKNGGKAVNQYIGTPFNDEDSIKANYYGTQMYPFDADEDAWGSKMADNAHMTPFLGYNLISYTYNSGDLTLSMTGTLNQTTTPVALSMHYGTYQENVYANSWVAPIKIKAFVEDDFGGSEGTIYIFNSGTPDQYTGANDGTAGNYSTFTPGTAKTTDVIASMESFSVYSTAASQTLTLDYSKLVYAPALDSIEAGKGISITPNRAPALHQGVMTPIKLRVTGENGWADEVKIFVREDFTDGFENTYDGHKIFGYDDAPQLYAVTEAGNLAINCVPDVEGTVLGFKAGKKDSTYTFTFEYDEEDELYLLDTEAKKPEDRYTRVETGGSYRFGADDVGSHNRFVLTRYYSPQTPTGGEEVRSDEGQGTKAIKIMEDNKIFILYRGVLYDATGKRVEERRAQQ